MSAKGIADQRTAIYDALVALNIGNVDKYSRKDPIPPGVMINGPRIDFPDNSHVGLCEWSIWLMGVRTAPADSLQKLDDDLTAVLLALSNGLSMGLVLQRVENSIRNADGIPLPGFTIVATAAVPNC